LCARIDYTDPAGIAPATVLYVKVAGNDAGYESDDAASGGVPANPALLPVGGKLNRSLVPSDVDWVRLVLP
jgi:hypothetical protein